MSLDQQRPSAASTSQQAAEQAAWLWIGRMQGRPSAAQREAFERWLYADVTHIEAYAQAQELWKRSWPAASALAVEEDARLRQYLVRMAERPAAGRRWGAVLAMAASLALVVWGGGWKPVDRLLDLGADYVSAPGEIRTLTLADGSVITLDADSAVSVDLGAAERHVELRRGGAFFEVSHGEVPFVVEAAGGEARVLGTRFGVRLRHGGARVTVEQGRVGVTAAPGQPQAVLGANQQLAYSDGKAAEAWTVDASAQLAWREGRLTFYKTPLADVLADLARYYPGRIVLLDDELAARRISGSFPSNDPHAILDSLRAVVGFRQHEVLGRLIVLR
ncbi:MULTISPECIES: FecR family protein [unclassified Pseudomonas]|uniref:FecR family protein n=1 Tax=unclassified Pseudomonas TaxID=196821 RepID=UPI000DA9E3AC|nr:MULTISPECIES: FecR family protein [unclassified Pseudomonas]MDW3714236.1 FecR family protein [Pseudomonas sp. 2023EL-01195]PZE11268.1 FecR family protein [Pseudomonas sp. 57B-090624]